MAKTANNSLILLSSPEGQQMLKDVHKEGKYYQPLLHGVFAKQIGRSNCGITSIAMLMSASKISSDHSLNAVSIGTKFNAPIPEAKLFDFKETLSVANQETVGKFGLTLNSVVSILKAHKCDVFEVYASNSSVDEFRESVKEALGKQDSKKGVIVNYLMSALGQGPFGGHHSPIVAYHENSDRFLILDTWPETEECWAKADDIYLAMNTIDKDSGKTRGFCISTF